MKWHIHETCGNSPKNQMLFDWIQAFFDQNKPLLFIDESSVFIFSDEIQPFASIDPPTNLEKIQIKKAITHGKVGAVLGQAMANHEIYPFALFFEFSLGKQPKIKEVECIVSFNNL